MITETLHGAVSTATGMAADLRSGFIGAGQQLLHAERRFAGSVFVFDAMIAARLTQVLAQQLAGLWIEQTDLPGVFCRSIPEVRCKKPPELPRNRPGGPSALHYK